MKAVPKKTYAKPILVRGLSLKVIAILDRLAISQGRNRSQQIEVILTRAARRYQLGLDNSRKGKL